MLAADYFTDEARARAYMERLRWPDGKECSHCGAPNPYGTKREGRYRCSAPDCRKDFTVTTGTVFEGTHMPLRMWLVAFYYDASVPKASAYKLLDVLSEHGCDATYKTAWFMMKRIRVAKSYHRDIINLEPTSRDWLIP